MKLLCAASLLLLSACTKPTPPAPPPAPPAPPPKEVMVRPADHEKFITINVVHEGGDRWRLKSCGIDVTADASLLEWLTKEADEERGQDPKNPNLTERHLRVAGNGSAAWETVERVLLAAASTGYYKIDWYLPEIDAKRPKMNLYLPKDRGLHAPPNPALASLEPIRIGIAWNPVSKTPILSLGERSYGPDSAALLKGASDMVAVYRRAGIRDITVTVAPSPGAPWGEIMRLLRQSNREEVERVDFARSSGAPNAAPIPAIIADDED